MSIVSRRSFLATAAIGAATGRAAEPGAYHGASLDHVILRTADPDRSADFYTRYFGVPGVQIGAHGRYLRFGQDYVGFLEGAEPGLEYFAVAVRDLDGDPVLLEDPDGLTVRVTAPGRGGEASILREAPDESIFQGRELNHIALRVTDVAASRDFYRDTFGLPIARESSGSCFLQLGGNFIALFQGAEAGMDHFCIAIEDYDAAKAMEILRKRGRDPHRAANRVYFPDPDGIEVQLAAADHRP